MIDLDSISAEVDDFLSNLLEAPTVKAAKPKAQIPKSTPAAPRCRPWRPSWKSEALILVTHDTTCACGRRFTSPAGLLVRFRHRDGRTIWETAEHASATNPDLPRIERRLKVKTLFCHDCFEQNQSQIGFDLQLWPAHEIYDDFLRESIDSLLQQPLD